MQKIILERDIDEKRLAIIKEGVYNIIVIDKKLSIEEKEELKKLSFP